ncbi:hypothetical protein MFUM_450002 [Methylacidiphilum fumariolicum SolV]|uniref:Uncharacterized protein n=2 Tax=Candidatus Methylacidiphilum fumarolicum TaxID=591154 RepID=I0JY64_METFB|nr:conserved protein of unknown function [Candidatus Methylacidiphilum fumarolicum]CCG92183.1 hypothetical protein MFUM_450002 [Methylacidiphilum fumariolicum SolV]
MKNAKAFGYQKNGCNLFFFVLITANGTIALDCAKVLIHPRVEKKIPRVPFLAFIMEGISHLSAYSS